MGNTTGTAFGPPRIGLDIPQGLCPSAFDRVSTNVRATIDRMGLGDDASLMGSRVGGHKECLRRVRDFLRRCT